MPEKRNANDNELMHYGVLGMRWGIRRSETSSGGRHSLFKKKSKQTSEKPTEQPKKKTIKDMSDDELRKAINRLEMEKRYKDLNPKHVSRGQQFVKDFANKAIAPAINEAGKNLARDYLTKVGKKKLGLDIKDVDQAHIDWLAKEVKKMNLEKSYRNLKEELKK